MSADPVFCMACGHRAHLGECPYLLEIGTAGVKCGCVQPDELTRLRAEVAAKDEAIATWGETVTRLQREIGSLRKQIAEHPDTKRLDAVYTMSRERLISYLARYWYIEDQRERNTALERENHDQLCTIRDVRAINVMPVITLGAVHKLVEAARAVLPIVAHAENCNVNRLRSAERDAGVCNCAEGRLAEALKPFEEEKR